MGGDWFPASHVDDMPNVGGGLDVGVSLARQITDERATFGLRDRRKRDWEIPTAA